MSAYMELAQELDEAVRNGQDTETALKIMELERLDRIAGALENLTEQVNISGIVTVYED